MKLSILYVSQTGNTEAAAETIRDGILARYPFIEVRLMDIRENEVDTAFLEQSETVIFGSPVYFTSMSWELKKWFDHSFSVKLRGKLGAAFVTAKSPAGGTDTAIMEILRHMLIKGMYVFSGMGQNPKYQFQLGALALPGGGPQSDDMLEAFGECVAEAAVNLFGK